ncbi:MAG TPA: hypothetical protein VGP72_07175 [Planctomycetota bacterium]|jgi:hypothetical protein
MIIALLILDRNAFNIQDKSAPEAPPSLEQLISAILRGPFGLTVVGAPPDLLPIAHEHFRGFAVQTIPLTAAESRPLGSLQEALTFCGEARGRWEKASAAAAARFSKQPSKQGSAGPGSAPGSALDPQTRAKLHSSPDVKLRGLARSLERDGVMLFHAEPHMTPELQAQLVEAFGREGAAKGPAARPFTQAVYSGVCGFPVLLSLAGIEQIMALPQQTDFDAWLLQNLERVQDVAL